MLASLAAGGGRGAPGGGAGAGGMRELDSEAPVIWPAWCYSEAGLRTSVNSGTPLSSLSKPCETATILLDEAGLRRHGGAGDIITTSSSLSKPRETATDFPDEAGHRRNGGNIITTSSPLSKPRETTTVHSDAESGGVGAGERARAAAATRRCARDPAPAPALSLPQQPSPHQLPLVASVKSERLSPSHNNDNRSSISRSRSVTPSTSSYPGTPPERDASPAAPAPAPAPARNYSDIMRSLAARYNHAPQAAHSDFFHPSRTNGFTSALDARLGLAKVAGALLAPSNHLTSGSPLGASHGSPLAGTGVPTPARTSPVCPDSDQPIGGLFASFSAAGHGRQQRVPAFPAIIDMSSTKTLLAMAKAARSNGVGGSSRTGRESRRSKRSAGGGGPEHSPLDLSAGAELAKRARRSSASSASHASSPRPASPKDHDERRSDTESREERSGERGVRECACAGGCYERLAAWAVDDVCDFVQSIDICAEYAPNFREQRIDGSGLPLLTEDHLTGMLQMKLGPALKLKAMLRKRLANCQRCSSPARADRLNGGGGMHVKSEPNSHSSSPS